MSSQTTKNKLARLYYLNEAFAGFGDSAGLQPSAEPGVLNIRLCTDAVVVTNSQIGTEYSCAAGGRIDVARSTDDLTVAEGDDKATNIADLIFGARTADETIKYVEAWLNATNTTEAYRFTWFELATPLEGTTGSQPKIAAGTLKLKAL